MAADPDVARLEAERLRPMPAPLDPLRELLHLIAGQCVRAGMLAPDDLPADHPSRGRAGRTLR